MTVKDDALDRGELSFFCRVAQRRGLSARQALHLWREAGHTVADTTFRAMWREQRTPGVGPVGRYQYNVEVRERRDR